MYLQNKVKDELPNEVYLISIPTPFPVGDVNAYLIIDDKIVLVDTGPKTDVAFEILKRGLSSNNIRIKDIDEIWLTHGHPDHFGLALQLAEISGADILKPPDEKANFEHKVLTHGYENFYKEGGIPDEYKDFAFKQLQWYESFSDALEIPANAFPGSTLNTGKYSFRIISVPGHSPGHVAFLEESGFAFGGDVLIENISSNAVIAFDEKTGERRDSLGELRDSMEQLGKMASLVFPGHENIITEPAAVAAKHMKMQEKRLEKIIQKLNKPKSLFQLSLEMFPKARDPEILFLATSEVIGYLDWGVNSFLIQKDRKDSVIYYKSE